MFLLHQQDTNKLFMLKFYCFRRYDAKFKINNYFQILVLGTSEEYPALHTSASNYLCKMVLLNILSP